MMEVLVDDIGRYEKLAERDELYAVASALAGDSAAIELDPVEEVQLHDTLQPIEIDETVTNNEGRYKNFSIQDTENFIQDNRNRNTIYKTKSDIKMFYEWCNANGEMRAVEDIPLSELDGLLARFYLGVRRRDGEEYEPDTLTGVQNSIDRHLKDNKIHVDIKKDELFSHSRRVLEAKRKELKSQGKGNKKNKAESLEADEIQVLYNKQMLGAANPTALLNTVWLNNGVFFGFRGRQEHANLRLGDLKLLKDATGKEFVEFYERNTKTRSGAKSGDQRPVTPKMFSQPNNEYCPVKMFKMYVARRPLDLRDDPNSRFYLRSLDKPDDEEVWYSHQPLGKNKLGLMMKSMAIQGELMGRKVNHSTRKTFASTLLRSERPNTEVAQLGGWKSVATLTHYNVPSLKQQDMASNILSEIALPQNSNVPENEVSGISNISENESDDCKSYPTTSMENPTNSQPVITNSTSISSKMIANKKETNPFSILCGASITGGVINLNIFSGKRKHFELDSSQE